MGLKIAMITPWKVRCGIATYSEALSLALSQLDVEVYIVRLPRFGRKTPEILLGVVDSIPDVDLVHVQHEYGLYQGLEGGFYGALETLNKPVITTMHAVGNWEVDPVVSSVSKVVIVHNEFCKNRFLPSLKQGLAVIPHGCKYEEAWPPLEAKKAYGINPPIVPIVGYLGFISSYKGLETLIEAMIKVPSAGLLIGGGWHTAQENEYATKLKERSLKILQSRCQWLGYIEDADLPKAYGAMDIVVYPSRFSTESGALLMALSHGKVVIASDISPFKEKEKEGAIMTFKNENDLAKKIKRVLKDKELKQKLEESAKKYAEENSWINVAKRHCELYQAFMERTA